MADGFFLSILEDYVPQWTVENALRELLQNLIDGAIDNVGEGAIGGFKAEKKDDGYELLATQTASQDLLAKIEYSSDTSGYNTGILRLINYGVQLPKSVFLMGATSKRDSQIQCGKFGEGMKTGLVKLLSSGCSVQIHNGENTWVVGFRYDPNFDDPQKRRSLHITEITRTTGSQNDLEIVVSGLWKKHYENAVSRCLKLQGPPSKDEAFVGASGSLFFRQQDRGKIYIKGIFVETRRGMVVGVDINNDDSLNLGRDRTSVADYLLAESYMKVWSEAVCSNDDTTRNCVKRLLERLETEGNANNFEKRYAEHITDEGTMAISNFWKEIHGDNAIPLPNDGSLHHSQYLVQSVLRRKAVIVNRELYNVLATAKDMDTLISLSLKLRMHLQTEVVATGSEMDLELDDPAFDILGRKIPSDLTHNSAALLPQTKAARNRSKVKLEKDMETRMKTITACLVTVLGLKDEQIQFCRHTGEALPVFVEPSLGKGRLVVAALEPDVEGGEYRPAIISSVMNSGCHVDFGNGSKRVYRSWKDVAAPSSQREVPWLYKGLPVVCPYYFEKIWYKGIVQEVLCDGGKIKVAWDDGSEPETFATGDCAFLLDSGNVINQPNVFINLDALNDESAHAYFEGQCVEKAPGCACIFRLLTDTARRNLGGENKGLREHQYHHLLSNFLSTCTRGSVDWSAQRKKNKFRSKVPMQACKREKVAPELDLALGGKPENWPKDVEFFSALKFSSLDDYQKNVADNVLVPGIKLQPIDSDDHPCKGQLGVFARENFSEDHMFGHYAGEVYRNKDLGKQHSDAKGKYYMDYGGKDEFTIDAKNVGNELRFVNDYREVAEEPNVEFVMKDEPWSGLIRVALVSTRKIYAGDELLCDYGQQYWAKFPRTGNSGTKRKMPALSMSRTRCQRQKSGAARPPPNQRITPPASVPPPQKQEVTLPARAPPPKQEVTPPASNTPPNQNEISSVDLPSPPNQEGTPLVTVPQPKQENETSIAAPSQPKLEQASPSGTFGLPKEEEETGVAASSEPEPDETPNSSALEVPKQEEAPVAEPVSSSSV